MVRLHSFTIHYHSNSAAGLRGPHAAQTVALSKPSPLRPPARNNKSMGVINKDTQTGNARRPLSLSNPKVQAALALAGTIALSGLSLIHI